MQQWPEGGGRGAGVPQGRLGWREYLVGLAPIVLVPFVLAGLMRSLNYPLPFENVGDADAAERDAAEAAAFVAGALALAAAAALPSACRGLAGRSRWIAAILDWERVPFRHLLRAPGLSYGNAEWTSLERVESRYGCDGEVLWPRLRRLLPEHDRRSVAAAELRRDLTLAAAAGFLLAALIAFGIAAAYVSQGWIAVVGLAVALATAVIAWRAYEAAVRAAREYAYEIEIAFDLHRVRLLQHMGLRLPDSPDEERALFEELSRALRKAVPVDAAYRWRGGEMVGAEELLANVEERVDGTVRKALEVVPEAVTDGVQMALRGTPLVNYDGWVSVEVLDDGRTLELSDARELAVTPGRRYELVVTIGPDRGASIAEPLVVSGGVEQPAVEFRVEIDSDLPALRHAPTPLVVTRTGAAGNVRFGLELSEITDPPPWLWVRVMQGRRTLQNVELVAGAPSAAR